MKKYRVCVPVDYIQGHLRYGHKEMVIESEHELSKEEIVEIAKEEIGDVGDLIVDDYSVNDCGDLLFSDLSYKEEN